MASITTRIQLPSDHPKKKSLCLPTSDSRVRFWRVMVNGAQSRSTLRRISKAKSSIRSCIGHQYVYVYELGCRIVALKSWYLLVFSVRYSETMFMNETLRNLIDAFTVHGPPWHGLGPVSISDWTPLRRLIVRSCEVSKPQHLCYPIRSPKLSHRSEIWEAPWQQGYRDVFVKIFKTTRKHKLISRLRDFTRSYFKNVIGVLSNTETGSVVVSILTGPDHARS